MWLTLLQALLSIAPPLIQAADTYANVSGSTKLKAVSTAATNLLNESGQLEGTVEEALPAVTAITSALADLHHALTPAPAAAATTPAPNQQNASAVPAAAPTATFGLPAAPNLAGLDNAAAPGQQASGSSLTP